MSFRALKVADLDHRVLPFLPATRIRLVTEDLSDVAGGWRRAPALGWLDRADSAEAGR